MARGDYRKPHHLVTCRRVWHVISRTPGKSIRQIARETGLASSTVQSALRTLKDVYGYIDYPSRAEGGRTILVSFYDEKETK